MTDSTLLAPYLGRIVDVDAHEMMPTKVWTREFGDIAAAVAEIYEESDIAVPGNPNSQYLPDFVADDMPINDETVWRQKGGAAPGATDLTRRVDVINQMGVQRQLLFPTSVGLLGAMLRSGHAGFKAKSKHQDIDLQAYSQQLFEAHNAWAVKAQQVSDRLRPVAVVQGASPADVFNQAQDLVKSGIRGIWLLASELLGGVSPAHALHDQFWDLLASNNVTAALHIGDGTILKTEDWGGAPVFSGFKESLEVNLAPWHMASIHLACQNYVTTMVQGGVFDRHPALRFGAIEVGGFWIGPLAYQLDVIDRSGGIMRSKQVYRLPEPPSFYIQRNVRVSAFDWEPVDEYIEMYKNQGIDNVLCFASDYPHVEGGREPLIRFSRRLERLGPEIMEKFFVTNGAYLIPE
jgi:predicted TIM-barrel fold metal-dependent hydrolase